MDNYFTSIVNSTSDYLDDLQYLGYQNPKTLSNLFDLQILCETYRWMVWQEDTYTEANKECVLKIIDNIILKDPHLENIAITNTYYKNVNTPQSLWTWQRIYDQV